MNKYFHILVCVALALSSCARKTLPLTDADYAKTAVARDTLVIMSYNLENFFDPDDDPAKADEDFTPDGPYHWTENRMISKAKRIARVITSASPLHLPEVVGLCEIEGPAAAKALVCEGGLDNGNTLFYKPVCFPTPDGRGVATAMLYDDARVELLDARPLFVSVPDSGMMTRDVLMAHLRLRAAKRDFYVFVNHWPSKYGGELETIWKRNHVAARVRTACDSILARDAGARIVLVGDFNDTADVEALTEHLGARTKDNTCLLRNLSDDTEDRSYKYHGVWNTIDHIIVTPGCCRVARPQFSVVKLPFLLEPDDRYSGDKPKRTYLGRHFNYAADNNGGYSDHLPVMIRMAVD